MATGVPPERLDACVLLGQRERTLVQSKGPHSIAAYFWHRG